GLLHFACGEAGVPARLDGRDARPSMGEELFTVCPESAAFPVPRFLVRNLAVQILAVPTPAVQILIGPAVPGLPGRSYPAGPVVPAESPADLARKVPWADHRDPAKGYRRRATRCSDSSCCRFGYSPAYSW